MRRDPRTDVPDLFAYARDYLHAYLHMRLTKTSLLSRSVRQRRL
jgi:hypothetical protein